LRYGFDPHRSSVDRSSARKYVHESSRRESIGADPREAGALLILPKTMRQRNGWPRSGVQREFESFLPRSPPFAERRESRSLAELYQPPLGRDPGLPCPAADYSELEAAATLRVSDSRALKAG